MQQLQDMLSSIQEEVRQVEGVELRALGPGWARLQDRLEETIKAAAALEEASQASENHRQRIPLANEMNRRSEEVNSAFRQLSLQAPPGSSQLEIVARYEAHYSDIHGRLLQAGFHSVGMVYPPEL